MLKEADTNKDGLIQEDEFLEMMDKNPKMISEAKKTQRQHHMSRSLQIAEQRKLTLELKEVRASDSPLHPQQRVFGPNTVRCRVGDPERGESTIQQCRVLSWPCPRRPLSHGPHGVEYFGLAVIKETLLMHTVSRTPSKARPRTGCGHPVTQCTLSKGYVPPPPPPHKGGREPTNYTLEPGGVDGRLWLARRRADSEGRV